MKKILIIDDDSYKADSAERALRNIFNSKGEETNFERAEHMRDVMLLDKSGELQSFNLIILDMNFPMYHRERVQLGLGNSVIHRINHRKYDVPIIVFTSEPDLLREDSENIIGTVKFESSVWDEPKFEEVINNHFI
ncbi:MAG: hypothetical protein J6A59_09865 [Lachnospiraceae bacterium]|nr:hypothetical protein [Lachnospiraceae bacterium]